MGSDKLIINSVNKTIRELAEVANVLDDADFRLDITIEEHRIALQIITKAYMAVLEQDLKD